MDFALVMYILHLISILHVDDFSVSDNQLMCRYFTLNAYYRHSLVTYLPNLNYHPIWWIIIYDICDFPTSYPWRRIPTWYRWDDNFFEFKYIWENYVWSDFGLSNIEGTLSPLLSPRGIIGPVEQFPQYFALNVDHPFIPDQSSADSILNVRDCRITIHI